MYSSSGYRSKPLFIIVFFTLKIAAEDIPQTYKSYKIYNQIGFRSIVAFICKLVGDIFQAGILPYNFCIKEKPKARNI